MAKTSKTKSAAADEGANAVRTPDVDELPFTRFTTLVHAEIDASPDNPRKDFADEDLDELAASIRQRGLIHPITVLRTKDKRHIIIDGERRWRAIGRAIKTKGLPADWPIPVGVRSSEGDLALVDSLIANMQRADLTPLEEAEALRQLQELDPDRYATGRLAAMLGKTSRHIQLRLALVEKLAPEVQTALQKGEIELAHAREITTVPKAFQADVLEDLRERLDYDHVTADDLKVQIDMNRVDASLAIFDLGEHADRIVDGDKKGERWFVGKPLFLELQKKAATAKAKELRKEWAWAEVSTGYFFANEFEEKTSKDRKKAGVLISIDQHTGRVTEHAGLVKPTGDEDDDSSPAKPTKGTSAKWGEEIERASAELEDGISVGLSRQPMMAVRLLIYGTLTADMEEDELAHFSVSCHAGTYIYAKHFEAGAPLAPWRERYGWIFVEDRQPADDQGVGERLWQEIMLMPDSELMRLHAAIIGLTLELQTWNVNDEDSTISGAVISLANAAGVPLPPVLAQLKAVKGADTVMAQAFTKAKGKKSKTSAAAPSADAPAVESGRSTAGTPIGAPTLGDPGPIPDFLDRSKKAAASAETQS